MHDTAPARLLGPDIDLWLLRPDACSADDLASTLPWLAPAEHVRYRAYVFERNRVEYLATRALVRTALSSYCPVEPAAWQFDVNAFGRPQIDRCHGLRFNLANHPTMVVCAIRGGAELGVDVEPVTRGADILDIATTVFAPGELADLRALPAPAQPDRALSLWTLKEAYIKARGMGLSLPLAGFAFSFDRVRPRISFAPAIDDVAERWRFHTADLLDHRIALAIEATEVAAAIRVHRVVRLSAAGCETERLADWP